MKLGIVDATTFLAAFKKLAWHAEYRGVVAPFEKFLTNATADGRISEWIIAWPQPAGFAGLVKVPELGGDVPVITRRRRSGRIDFIGSDDKHRAALMPLAVGEGVPGLAGAIGRGVALVYLVDDRAENSDRQKVGDLTLENVVPLLSLAAPLSATSHKRDLIQWTVRVSSKKDDAAVEIQT
jgi:hypothetical protein